MRRLFLVLAVCTAFAPAIAEAKLDVDRWREDLRYLAAEMPQRHPDLYFRMTKASWDSAVAAIETRLPTMERPQTIVALMELVALPRDGHTAIFPTLDSSLGFHYYPIDLYEYEDGVFVYAADPAHASLVGARVVRIGSAPIEQALAAVSRTISAENEWWQRAWAAERLAIPEILEGLGLAATPNKLPLEIERNGKKSIVVLAPAGTIEPQGHNPLGGIDRSGWIRMGEKGEQTLWRRDPGKPFGVEYVSRDSMLYVRYRGVIDGDGSETNVQFWRRVFALSDSLPIARFVLDLRENIGGNSFFNRQVVRGLIKRPALDRKDRLFVITGRRTFSAAMNLALDLERWTNATFVGEPTGNATMFFGDHRPLELPNSHIAVNVSSLPWHPDDPRDHRSAVAPTLYTPLRSSDDLAHRDPAVQAILATSSRPDLAAQIRAAAERGDSLAVERVVKDAQADELNRFRDVEAVVNQAGYGLMSGNRTAAALTVFRINTRLYPHSPNAWDSFGESLAQAGRREEAIRAYRRALEIDPEFGSAHQALARLTGKQGS